MTKEELIAFEKDIERLFIDRQIRAPVHLSSGNEDALIEIFTKYYNKGDWIYSNWRNHYHVLLAGADPAWVKQQILSGYSMSMSCKDPKFISSSIVGGLVGQAVGTAWGLKEQDSSNQVICFVGDMTAETGSFHEAQKYAENFDLPILFVIEDNGLSVGTPTVETWGNEWIVEALPHRSSPDNQVWELNHNTIYYKYTNTLWPHVGVPVWVGF